MTDILQQHHGSQVFEEDPEQLLARPGVIYSHDPQGQIKQGETMAQPIVQRQYLGHSMHNQAWPSQQTLSPDYKKHQRMSAGIVYPCIADSAQESWLGVESNLAWSNDVPTEPFIMPEYDTRLELHNKCLVNRQWLFPQQSHQDNAAASPTMFNDLALQRGVSAVQGSDLGTDTSASPPGSFFSDLSEYDQSLSPKLIIKKSPLDYTWKNLEPVSQQGFNRSSSRETQLSTLGPDPNLFQPSKATVTVDFSGLPHDGLSMVTPSVERRQGWASEEMGIASTTGVGSNTTSWASSSSQITNLNTRSWYPGYEDPISRLPYVQQDHSSSASFTHDPDATILKYEELPQLFGSDFGSEKKISQPQLPLQFRPGEWGQKKVVFSAQDDFQLAPAADIQVERKAEDKLLLDWKAAGLTYKEIKNKMHTKVAESTLRGRYRSLTKARKDRVRKPVWTEHDVELLKAVVTTELERLDGRYCPLNRSQKLSKLSWKRIAEQIAAHGGSYHFGNSTCKKKWLEVDSDCS